MSKLCTRCGGSGRLPEPRSPSPAPRARPPKRKIEGPPHLPSWERWCRIVGHNANDLSPALLSHYREKINLQRGLAR